VEFAPTSRFLSAIVPDFEAAQGVNSSRLAGGRQPFFALAIFLKHGRGCAKNPAKRFLVVALLVL
jgi:hypothetical protein